MDGLSPEIYCETHGSELDTVRMSSPLQCISEEAKRLFAGFMHYGVELYSSSPDAAYEQYENRITAQVSVE
jgi:hypothetical protein